MMKAMISNEEFPHEPAQGAKLSGKTASRQFSGGFAETRVLTHSQWVPPTENTHTSIIAINENQEALNA